MKQARREQREREWASKVLALPNGKFGVVVEDYEWHFKIWSKKGEDRHASNHYVTGRDARTAAEIVERTKDRFTCAAKDCVLLMWTTSPHLMIAGEVMRPRGFTYKTSILWDKEAQAHGYWTRGQHELVLVGTQGDPELLLIGTHGKVPCPAEGTQWPSIFHEKKREHSRKPEAFYRWVETFFPNVPKIELNCRGAPRPGWSAWGNEAVLKEAAE
jgi:N6-adenosine-specific RNA methylase IME4